LAAAEFSFFMKGKWIKKVAVSTAQCLLWR